VARSFDAKEASEIGFITRIAEPESWPGIVAEAQSAAQALPDDARASLYAATGDHDDDRDLALLVRSAAIPGLGERIRTYIKTSR
jgi:enoyl-CoA hydratase/carnithine racemase